MGNNSRPSRKDIQKINDSLTKMGTIRVFVDNKKESDAYPSYPHVRFDEILLDFVRGSKVEVNGAVSESAIRIKSEPCMGRFANVRKQIRNIDMKLLNAPINKTERNMSIMDYLLYLTTTYQATTTKKITYETFFERVGVSDKKQKQRALETAEKVLAYYKTRKWIAGYTMEKDGIVIVKKAEKRI